MDQGMDQGMERWRDGENCKDRRKGDDWFGDEKMKIRLGGGGEDGHNMVSKKYSAPSYNVIQEEVVWGVGVDGRFGQKEDEVDRWKLGGYFMKSVIG